MLGSSGTQHREWSSHRAVPADDLPVFSISSSPSLSFCSRIAEPGPKRSISFFVSTCDDGQARKGIHVDPVPEVMIVVKVGVQYKANRLVCPLANLIDVLLSSRRYIAGIHYQDLPFTNDHGRIAAPVAIMLDLINAVGHRRPSEWSPATALRTSSILLIWRMGMMFKPSTCTLLQEGDTSIHRGVSVS
jgi:hypothetical protein